MNDFIGDVADADGCPKDFSGNDVRTRIDDSLSGDMSTV